MNTQQGRSDYSIHASRGGWGFSRANAFKPNKKLIKLKANFGVKVKRSPLARQLNRIEVERKKKKWSPISK